VPALQPTDLRSPGAKCFGIVGHSGAGKSTCPAAPSTVWRNPPAGLVSLSTVKTLPSFGRQGLRAFRPPGRMNLPQAFQSLSSKTVADNVALPLNWPAS